MTPLPPWASNHLDRVGFLLLALFGAFVAGMVTLIVRSPEARRRWFSFWFEPVPATSLGILRVIFYGGVLFFYLRFDFGLWGYVPDNFYRPIFWFDVLHLGAAGPYALRMMAIVWRLAVFLCLIGLGFRYATWVVVVLGFYLWGLGNNFAKTGHGDAVLLWTSFFFALSRANDWLSLDAAIAQWRRKKIAVISSDAGPRRAMFGAPISGEYKWPIRLVWVLMCLVFFAAGSAKLRRSGLEWITSDNMRTVLIQHHYQMFPPPTRIGLTIAAHPWMYHANAGGAVLLELAMPLALVSRRLRVVLVPAAGLMQLGIGLTMGVWFTQWFLCYMFFVPWGPMAEWVGRKLRVSPTADATPTPLIPAPGK